MNSSKFRQSIHLLNQLILKHGQKSHTNALKALTDPLKGYTVVGIYADNQQSWVAYVGESEASNPREAAIKGIEKTYDEGRNGVELEDIAVIEVLEGVSKGVLGNDVYVTLENLKDPKCPWLPTRWR